MGCESWLTSHHILSPFASAKTIPISQKKDSGRELKSPSNLNVYCYMSVNRTILSSFSFQPHLSRCQPKQPRFGTVLGTELIPVLGLQSQGAGKEIMFPRIVTAIFISVFSTGGVNVITITYSTHLLHQECFLIMFPRAPLLYHYSTELVTTCYLLEKLTNSRLWDLADMFPVREVSFCKRQEPTLRLTHDHLHICVCILEATMRKQIEKQRL